MDTVARGEIMEAELDAVIRRRHDKRVAEEGERAAEEAWAESARRQTVKLREAAPPPPRSPCVRHVLHSAGLPDLVTDR